MIQTQKAYSTKIKPGEGCKQYVVEVLWPKPIKWPQHRAAARILFQPRQRGKPWVWGLAEPSAESRGRAPGQGSGAKPPEAKSFSVVGCPKEMENVLQFYYFTTYLLLSKMS